jgi:hypothetical protein
MSKKYTYEQVAKNFELWGEYVDTDANMTEEEFDALSTEEKVEMQEEMFGKEEDEEDE